MNVFEELRNDVQGGLLLADWIGDGGEPVSQAHADYRADACLHGNGGSLCPFNVEPNWWDRVKEAIAETIRAELELKNRLQLHATGENDLSMCSKCGCCLKLLVWTPKKRLKEHTRMEKLEDLPTFCWKRRELETS